VLPAITLDDRRAVLLRRNLSINFACMRLGTKMIRVLDTTGVSLVVLDYAGGGFDTGIDSADPGAKPEMVNAT
ncbi:MAG: hypothetical protein WBV28_20330, partial [Terracidiphilus sp.]